MREISGDEYVRTLIRARRLTLDARNENFRFQEENPGKENPAVARTALLPKSRDASRDAKL
jgi:hypothetical protein